MWRHSQQTKIGSAAMKKKLPVHSFPKTKAVIQSDRSWHNGGDIEIALYARSLHRAAKTLIETLDLQPELLMPRSGLCKSGRTHLTVSTNNR
jgi:hypothetical protein